MLSEKCMFFTLVKTFSTVSEDFPIIFEVTKMCVYVYYIKKTTLRGNIQP